MRRELREQLTVSSLRRRDLTLVLLDLAPPEHGERAEARIQREVNEPERDRDPEQPEPPTRQWIVALDDVAIPGVTRSRPFPGARFARPQDQPSGTDHLCRNEHDDEHGPAERHQHFSLVDSGAASSSSGKAAAALKSECRRRL